jgi:hypothetical protein
MEYTMTKAENPNTPIPSRRALLAGAPAAAAAALAAGGAVNILATATARPSSADDPVFDAIKRERDAYAVYCATSEAQTRISDQCPAPPPVKDGALDLRKNEKRMAEPAFKAWWAEYETAEDAHTESCQNLWNARVAFLETQPTTVPGLRAFVEHIEGPLSTGSTGKAFWDEQEREVAFPTLAAAVLALIGGARA